jgi:hypothetical protein
LNHDIQEAFRGFDHEDNRIYSRCNAPWLLALHWLLRRPCSPVIHQHNTLPHVVLVMLWVWQGRRQPAMKLPGRRD